MLAIPYGSTKAYGDLAKATGAIPRAVGTACGANPIPIFIPCHRVLAADRQLGGFSGGRGAERSEEHTSELQSLMRISYAVFCLKKKNKRNNPTDTQNTLHPIVNRHSQATHRTNENK